MMAASLFDAALDLREEDEEVEWIHESTLTDMFDIQKDGMVLRTITQFIIYKEDRSRSTGCSYESLENIYNAKYLGSNGYVLPASGDQTNGAYVHLGEISEWAIEFDINSTSDLTIWIRSKTAWYKLTDPTPGYLPTFKPLNSKVDVCSFIAQSLRKNKKIPFLKLLKELLNSGLCSKRDLMSNKNFIVNHISQLHPQFKSSDFINKFKNLKVLPPIERRTRTKKIKEFGRKSKPENPILTAKLKERNKLLKQLTTEQLQVLLFRNALHQGRVRSLVERYENNLSDNEDNTHG